MGAEYFDSVNRILLSSLAALAATLIVIETADAKPRTVQSVVTLPAGARLEIKLAAGSRVISVRGGTAKRKGRALTIAAKGKTIKLRTRGKAPQSWKVAGRSCTVKRVKATRLTVTCAVTAPAPGPGGTASPAGGTTTPGSTNPAGGTTSPAAEPFRFAPYADMAGWPPPPLDFIRENSGADRISLAFIVQSKAGGCDPTWGGYVEYPATGSGAYRRDHVAAFRQAGGDVVISFGGAEGTELALVCDDDALVTAYQSVIDAYGVTHLDFDIEGAMVHNTLANTRRAKAIAKLQRARPELVVTYTLASAVYGLEPKDEAIVDDALTQGVDIAAVNIMTMNFGAPFAPDMGALTIQAANGLHTQLAARYPSAQRRAGVAQGRRHADARHQRHRRPGVHRRGRARRRRVRPRARHRHARRLVARPRRPVRHPGDDQAVRLLRRQPGGVGLHAGAHPALRASRLGCVRRVAVIASASGNGKTTVGRRLAVRLGVPYVELDALVHGPGWVETPDDELRDIVEPIVRSDGWVIDGTYPRKLGSLVLDSADTVVWLDQPVRVWLPRLLRRTARRVTGRETLWNGNRETVWTAIGGPDSLIVFALRSHVRRRRTWPAKLARYPVTRLRTPADVERWIANA